MEIVKAAIPASARRGGPHPAKRTFQALRIEVNHELLALETGLRSAVKWLRPGGRIAVISYHSLEDRIVKQLFSGLSDSCTCPPGLPVCTCGHVPVLRVVTRRPIEATDDEVERNPRARSAKLRVAVNADSLGTWFPAALARFAAEDGARVEVSLDDEADSDVATQVAEKVKEAVQRGDRVLGVIGHPNSGQTAAAMAIYKDLPIIVVSPTASEAGLTKQGYRNFFRVNAANDLQAKTGAEYLANKLGAKKVAVLYNDDAYGKDLGKLVADPPEGLQRDLVGPAILLKVDDDPGQIVSGVSADVDAVLVDDDDFSRLDLPDEFCFDQVQGDDDVAVIGTPHPKWGEQVTAIVVARRGARLDAAAVAEFAAQRLAGFKKPRRVEFVDSLPRNAAKKVMTGVLRERFGREQA